VKIQVNNESASVILITMFLITILLVLVMGMTSIIINEIHISSYEENSIRAFYIAEAGINFAIIAINNELLWNSGNLVQSEIDNISNVMDDGVLLRVSKLVFEDEIKLTSTARSSDINKTINVIYKINEESGSTSLELISWEEEDLIY
jgi:hypothetical protein